MGGSVVNYMGGPSSQGAPHAPQEFSVGGRILRLGQLVTSRAGRDTGRAYLVVGFRPDGRVLVADGRYWRVARPKPKNPRHLWLHDRVATEVAERLQRGEPVTDSLVAEQLGALLEATEPQANP